MKFYITRYALTKGIVKAHGEITNINPEMIQLVGCNLAYIVKPYWHLRKEDAVEHAEKIKESKLKFLKKQMEKIEGLKFV